MQQIKSFTITASPTHRGDEKKNLGSAISETVNPFLAEHPDAKIESVNTDMASSFHKGIVLVSYEVPEDSEEGKRKRSRK